MLEIFMLLIGGGALAFVLYRFVRDQVRWYHANRPNRRVTLPPPPAQCRRAPDWRSQALSGR